jgi:zinc transport system ATP-binding protein
METVVQFEDVFFAYQQVPIINFATFKVFSGQFVGVIGPNGGGKTTLLKLILGFLKPGSGKIEIFGLSPQFVRTQMAYVPQALRFDRQFPISVLELVLSGCLSQMPWYGTYRKKDKINAMNALERVGIAHLYNHAFGTLSGGQAQRALIARALVSEPKLLLLDEPTASVDSQAEAEIYHILKQLQGQMTILMVTHDLRTAINQVDWVLCVQESVTTMAPQEVCEHYALGLYHAPLLNLQNKR